MPSSLSIHRLHYSSRRTASVIIWKTLWITWTFHSATALAANTKPVVTFVTGNTKKLEEVQQLLLSKDLPIKIENKNLDLPELQGDPIDIVREKCRLASQQVEGPVMVEDTCLCFHALGGLPGPYIKWFLEKCGLVGLNKMLMGFDDKSAYAQTVVALSFGSNVNVFSGETEGTIVPPRGAVQFGWDPIFEPHEGNSKTYAELAIEEKNTISHRGRAFAKLKKYLMEHADEMISTIQ